MKINQWTLGLAAVGVVSLGSVAQADEQKLVPLMTSVQSTTLSGYVDTSAIWRPGTGSDATPIGRVFDVNSTGKSKQDGFNLNVVALTLDKGLDEGKWSAGYHVEAIAGPDAVARGTGLTSSPGSEFAFNEAYVMLRAPVGNGLDFHIGQFATFAGYETFDSYKNPNYSRSYGWYLEPASHVGATASYTFNSILSGSAGVANSYSTFADAKDQSYESRKTYLGSLTLTAPDSTGFLKGSTLTLAYSGGTYDTASTVAVINPVNANLSTGSVAGLTGNRFNNYYAGTSVNTPLKDLAVGASFDYLDSEKFFAHALAGYLTYSVTDSFKLNGRLDWAHGSPYAFGYKWTNTGGGVVQDSLLAATITADYSLWANVTTRAELRWDHSLNSAHPFNNALTSGSLQKNEVTLALNVIYKF